MVRLAEKGQRDMITRVALVLAFLCSNYFVYYHLASEAIIPGREPFVGFPSSKGEWLCKNQQRMGKTIEENLGVTDYMICDWRNSSSGEQVNLYVGYHETQVREEGGAQSENVIHPPKHCLPGSGWNIIEHDLREYEIDGFPEIPAMINRLIIAKGEARRIVYYWYQSRGRVIAEDWRKIVALTWDRATRSRTDGALVRFTVPLSNGTEPTDDTFVALAGLLLPELESHIPQ